MLECCQRVKHDCQSQTGLSVSPATPERHQATPKFIPVVDPRRRQDLFSHEIFDRFEGVALSEDSLSQISRYNDA